MTSILQVITDTDRRGAQVFAVDLGAALERLGHDVRTVALAPGTVGGLDVAVLGAAAKAPGTLAKLRGEMKRSRLVIAHGSTTLPASALAGLGTGTPFIYRQISDSRFWAPDRVRRGRVRVALARATAVVALWSGSASVLCSEFGVRSSKLTVIPNGVPPARIHEGADIDLTSLGLAADRLTVLYVGALVPEKGVDLVVDSVGADQRTQLLLVGDGPQREELEAQAERIAPRRVAFVGQAPDVGPYYRAADLFVFPSRGGDSMPAALIEAGMASLPTIATPVDAIPEVVVDGETGLLVPIGDQFSFEAAIRRLVDAPDTRAALGKAARQHCLARFSIETVAEQWGQLLDRHLPRSRR